MEHWDINQGLRLWPTTQELGWLLENMGPGIEVIDDDIESAVSQAPDQRWAHGRIRILSSQTKSGTYHGQIDVDYICIPDPKDFLLFLLSQGEHTA